MKARILWIEGKRVDTSPFIPGLEKKGYHIEVASTGSEALDRVYEYDPDLAIINAASMRSNGKRTCKALREKVPELPIILIANPNFPKPDDSCASVILQLPFTNRKLVNRISPFIRSDSNHVIHAGPLHLDVSKKSVRCHGKETRLTPRLTQLLKALMSHPGEVLERTKLFQEIWNTDYTADTRTLDVHISWLRQAIEEDARKPKYLKTIRQIGYRLDV